MITMDFFIFYVSVIVSLFFENVFAIFVNIDILLTDIARSDSQIVLLIEDEIILFITCNEKYKEYRIKLWNKRPINSCAKRLLVDSFTHSAHLVGFRSYCCGITRCLSIFSTLILKLSKDYILIYLPSLDMAKKLRFAGSRFFCSIYGLAIWFRLGLYTCKTQQHLKECVTL
jgi:hypothetical protein